MLRPSHLRGTSGSRHRHFSGSNHLSLPSLHPRDPSCPFYSARQHWFPKQPPVKKYRKTQVKNHPSPRGKGRLRAAVPREAGEELWDGSEPPTFPCLRPRHFPQTRAGRRLGGLPEFRPPGYQQGKEPLKTPFLPQFLSEPTAPMEGKSREEERVCGRKPAPCQGWKVVPVPTRKPWVVALGSLGTARPRVHVLSLLSCCRSGRKVTFPPALHALFLLPQLLLLSQVTPGGRCPAGMAIVPSGSGGFWGTSVSPTGTVLLVSEPSRSFPRDKVGCPWI